MEGLVLENVGKPSRTLAQIFQEATNRANLKDLVHTLNPEGVIAAIAAVEDILAGQDIKRGAYGCGPCAVGACLVHTKNS